MTHREKALNKSGMHANVRLHTFFYPLWLKDDRPTHVKQLRRITLDYDTQLYHPVDFIM